MAKLRFNVAAFEALERARIGDYDLLADRIGDGSATPEERALACKLLKLARKPSHRPPVTNDHYMAIHDFICDKLNEQALQNEKLPKQALKNKKLSQKASLRNKKLSLKAPVEAAMKKFGLKKSRIYEIYAFVETAFPSR